VEAGAGLVSLGAGDAGDEEAATFGLRALVGAAFDGVERSQPGVVGLALNARLDELVLIAIGGRAGRDRAADLVLAEVQGLNPLNPPKCVRDRPAELF
jgi:hypothetical protein